MIIAIVVEVDERIEIPILPYTAADLLNSIYDGQLDGKVTIKEIEPFGPLWANLKGILI